MANNNWLVSSDDIKQTVSFSGTVTKAGTTTITGSSDAGKKVTLTTANKYVDRDIEVQIPASDATVSVTVADGTIKADAPTVTSGSASMATSTMETAASSDYYVTLSTSAGSAKSNAGVAGAGYVELTDSAQSDSTSVSVSGNGDKLYIQPGAASVASNQSISVSGSGTPTKNATSGKYEVSVSGSKTINGSVTTAGYMPTGAITGASVSASGKATINAANVSAVATNPGTSYTENTTAIVPSGGYLKIDAGYIPATKISLATLVPNYEDVEAQNLVVSDKVVQGFKAYDKDGKLVTGSIVERTSSDVSVSGTTTISVSGPAGNYAEGFDKELPLGAATVSGTGSKQATAPTVEKVSKPSSDTWTEATGTTVATSTKPTSGVYVAVKATAPATTGISVKQSSDSAGYVNLTGGTTQVGTASTTSNNSTYYVPVKEGALGDISCNAAAPSITSVTVGTKASGKYPLTGSASTTGTMSVSATTAGWISGSKTSSCTHSASLNASVNAGTLKVTNGTATAAKAGVSNMTAAAAGTPSVSGATYTATGFSTTAPTSGAYVDITPTLSKTSGSVSAATAGVNSEGYVKNETASGSAVTVSVTNDTIKHCYVPFYEGTFTVL